MAATTDHAPVLFAYDGSKQARAAIAQAGEQLGGSRRKAIVLTVWHPISALAIGGAPLAAQTTGYEEDQKRAAQRVADEGVTLAKEAGFDAESEVQGGEPIWQHIVDAADDHDAGIVVMGSHGRTGLGLVLLGSVAAAAARHTERPVLIAHTPSD